MDRQDLPVHKLTYKPVKDEDFLKKEAKDEHVELEVSEDCLFEVDGKLAGGIFTLPGDCKDIMWALKSLEYQKYERTGGLSTVSRTFGFLPRVSIRNDYCRKTVANRDFPKQTHILEKYGQFVNDLYKTYFPDVWEAQHKDVEDILDDYKIKDTIFTAGIINKNYNIAYHRDNGNFESSYNCMLHFKNRLDGGKLVVPELNVRLNMPNNICAIFDAQKFIHGVTPLDIKPLGYRYTVVYFSMEQMTKCLDFREEVERINRIKTQQAQKRLAKIKGED